MGQDIISLLTSSVWSIILIAVFFLGSIFVHELGHFLAARWRGLVVERFSIGFGPKMFGWTRNGVEYRISWFPLGGYVALPQLADLRGLEGESKTSGHPPISYTDKMVVAVAGAVFNLILAFAIATILWQVGVPKPAPQTTTIVGNVLQSLELPDGSSVPGPAWVAGVRPGDRIFAIDGRRVDDWLDLQQTVAAGRGRDLQGQPKATLSIERGGKEIELSVFPRVTGSDRFRTIGIEPAEPIVVASIVDGSPAQAAGLLVGDRVLSANGERLLNLTQLQGILMANRDTPVPFEIERAGKPLTLQIQPRIEIDEVTGQEVARIGILRSRFLTIKQDPITQIWDHVRMLGTILSGLISPASDLGFRHMSGPIGIAHGLHNLAQVSFLLVLWFVVLINVNLAILNLLPLPVLDGGHMVFATLAKIRGRDLPSEFVQTVQAAFIVILLGLFVYVSFFDTSRVIRDIRELRQVQEATPTPPSPPPEPVQAP